MNGATTRRCCRARYMFFLSFVLSTQKSDAVVNCFARERARCEANELEKRKKTNAPIHIFILCTCTRRKK